MRRPTLLPLTALAFVLLVGAAPPPTPESLLDQADAALLAEDYGRAIDLYEKAEPHAADPSRVTFYLATAKYRRALQDGSANDLDEAEQLYRCLLGEGEPRRPAALLGYGNCLLEKAAGRDRPLVLEAIEQYRECLAAAKAAGDDKLAADAAYNLELARLLNNQIRKAEEDKPPADQDPRNDTNPNTRAKPKQPDKGANPSHDPNNTGAGQKPVGMGERTNDPGGQAVETPETQGGAGPMRSVPDQPDQPPLSAREALEHLRQANERIWRERHQHRLGLVKPPPEGVRDW
jgi:tetratricopeptide (TPR) repeat protein